jgi:cysteinyl-tRNA synthetase
MSLKIHNTYTRRKEEFVPLEPGKITMYVCGMTVYDYCHLGHARVLVAFDVITRYLRSRGWDVTYVRNITDIDDKILNRANENGEAYTDLTERFIGFMHEDEKRLGIARPDQEPRATAHIDDIIAMVEKLIERDYAYQADNGDVYYAVSRFEKYGRLTNKNPDELLAGARIEVGEAKRDPRDFALWKAAAKDEVCWDSPWGPGRPGWHIECSAMSTCCLGDTFDIHGGGPDLPFPHHENEIAQSEAATGKQYVRYWMHAGAVRVDGEKMSKSLGNFFTIRDILDKYHPEAQSAWYQRFVEAMDDDFNTPVAAAVMYDLVRELNTTAKTDEAKAQLLASELKAMGAVLGILQENPEAFLQGGSADDLSAEQIEALIAERNRAKLDKDYARADKIREQLSDQGVVLEDSREGTKWRRA